MYMYNILLLYEAVYIVYVMTCIYTFIYALPYKVEVEEVLATDVPVVIVPS